MKVHWLLRAAGKGLALLLLALAGERSVGGLSPGSWQPLCFAKGGSSPEPSPALRGNGPDPTGITLPSAFSSVYYLLFVGMCTWWACHFRLSHLGFNALCIMVGVYAAGHLLCLYSYQAPYIQAFLPPTSIWAR